MKVTKLYLISQDTQKHLILNRNNNKNVYLLESLEVLPRPKNPLINSRTIDLGQRASDV